MKVCEIFASIQGESTYAGSPCVFVRLTGCNLRCSYCDTAYAYDEGREMPEDEIIGTVGACGIGLVEITGGEPLMQGGSLSLIRRLLDSGFTVLVETNGSMEIRGVDARAVIIMDIKTPSSGMSGKMDLKNLEYLKPGDELKFVIAGREDYAWAADFIRKHRLTGRCRLLMSPVYGMLPPGDLAHWIVRDRLPVRLNLQVHKYIYGPGERGV